MFTISKSSLLWFVVLVSLFTGCKKKVPIAPPPPPPAPSAAPAAPAQTPGAPVIFQFVAEPSALQRGQSSTLRWQVTGEVSSISINQGIGQVQNVDSRTISPNDSTSYTLTATGPGGVRTATVTVSVSSPPPPVRTVPPPPSAPTPADIVQRLTTQTQDAYFDFDSSEIRTDTREALTKDANGLKAILRDFPAVTIVIEGHCDERGSAEFNMGLSDRRATAAKSVLTELGVPSDKLTIIGYGKERPQCMEHNEECWQQNRRIHLRLAPDR